MLELGALLWALVAAFVTPGVNDKEKEDNEAENQEDDGPRLVVPKLLEVIHASVI